MEMYSGQIGKLIEELAALPGIGNKSAQRLAFHLINMPKDKVDRLAHVMMEAREGVRYCKECFSHTKIKCLVFCIIAFFSPFKCFFVVSATHNIYCVKCIRARIIKPGFVRVFIAIFCDD